MVKSCKICGRNSKLPKKEFTPWPKAETPFSRVHVDFLGPFKGHIWLILVDALSHFPFMVKMSQYSAGNTIMALKSIFSMEGCPTTLVSDNGPQFSSQLFKSFCQKFGIQHLFAPPYHPESNGQAERFVQTFKNSVLKSMDEGLSLNDAVFDFLVTYRSTSVERGKSPSKLLHGRQMRNFLEVSVGKPAFTPADNSKFNTGDPVWLREYGKTHRWEAGQVIKRLGSNLFDVVAGGKIYRRHQNQLKKRFGNGGNLNAAFDVTYSGLHCENSEDTQNSKDSDVLMPRRSARLAGKRKVHYQEEGKCYGRAQVLINTLV
ncbi:Pol polyprotein [Thelohanellus kitauei]|uniref:Pol polyprotein n=1 Tax=Thelohanellus kitauei TaxID=669202 RepID=A0A0C2JKE4_THEKT|nr:Pol polyprotein [Thelohanellus kitauei]